MRKVFGTIAAMAIVAGCAPRAEAPAPVDLKIEEAALMEASRAWARAAASRDAKAITDYWASDAVVMMPGAPTFRGAKEIRAYVDQSLAIPGFRISWEPLEAHVSASGDMGYLVERTEVTMPDASGAPVTEVGRAVTIWRKQANGEWKSVVDITNAGPPNSADAT